MLQIRENRFRREVRHKRKWRNSGGKLYSGSGKTEIQRSQNSVKIEIQKTSESSEKTERIKKEVSY